MKVIVTQRIQLEPTDIAQAITDYLKTNKVDALITVAHLEEFNEDFSLDIKVDGEAPVSKAPAKRRRKVATEKPVDSVTEQDGSTATEQSEPVSVKLTAAEMQAELDAEAADKENALAIQTEQAKGKTEAVTIKDDSPGEVEPDLMQQAIEEADAEEAAALAAEKANAVTEEAKKEEAEVVEETKKPLSKKSMFAKKLKKAD